MFCKTCGKENSDETYYCISCGAQLRAVVGADDTVTMDYSRSDRMPSPPPFSGRPQMEVHRDIPMRGSFDLLPLFGIFGLVLMVVTLMISLYTYSIVTTLESSLSDYEAQLSDDSLVGQIGGSIMDFFTNGALTQKHDDIIKMKEELALGTDILSVGVGCAVLSVIFSIIGVMRNIKKPTGGRPVFVVSFLFAIASPVLILFASLMMYIINTQLVICVTTALVGILMLLIEIQRIGTFRRSMEHLHPRL
ncbi:MAG: zinc ribbon domain-containing protein [Clostridiales bacterium]|jgi:hypothetical protein|nr:zinc ribbon domain-containing protein [Clostridiales bacterium]